MVDWRPIVGAIPPLTDDQWQQTFTAYQQYPEYQKINRGMPLSEFKSIFYWEYSHRLLGRLIGIIFFVPFLVFFLQNRFDRGMKLKMSIAFILGGAQGLMGWYMVKSGLVDEPNVSHYRLAAHLGFALFLLAYLFWTTLQIISRHYPQQAQFKQSNTLTNLLRVIIALLVIQIFYGALVAGLHAGIGYNTFPKMGDQWIANEVGALSPLWLNIFESNATIQFIHRSLGIAITLLITTSWVYGQKINLLPAQRWALHILLLAVLVQFSLGVATLLQQVPVNLASLHQGGAALLLLSWVYAGFMLTNKSMFVTTNDGTAAL